MYDWPSAWATALGALVDDAAAVVGNARPSATMVRRIARFVPRFRASRRSDAAALPKVDRTMASLGCVSGSRRAGTTLDGPCGGCQKSSILYARPLKAPVHRCDGRAALELDLPPRRRFTSI